MEHTDVVIVGAGPSGLALSLALSARQVKSIVLEANHDICEDPRAIAISGDTIRILHLLGIDSQKLEDFGQYIYKLKFHRTTFTTAPFFELDHACDYLQQGLHMGTCIFQPKLEQAMRDLIKVAEYAELRTGCRVTSCREVDNAVEGTYQDQAGSIKTIRGQFLVGADGKRGTIRKHILEPRGIKQETGLHDYCAIWIAANLRIKMPTPESHPSFPLWEQGYDPEELWDLFWPDGFHFCNHPTNPVAAGRFGSRDVKYWRFEYEVPESCALQDPVKDLETQMAPHLTISAKNLRDGEKLTVDTVQFPWDCVEIIRCQPALFTHKVVNRWFDNRTILIGDAAHVFPPFGAQGIANGIRDAHSLAWRLSLICDSQNRDNPAVDSRKLFHVWSQERREGVDQSSKITMRNGALLLNKSPLIAQTLDMANSFLRYAPQVTQYFLRFLLTDAEGYQRVKEGFFLPDGEGGGKMAQAWVRNRGGSWKLSDALFWETDALLSLLVVAQPPDSDETSGIETMLASAGLPPGVLSPRIVALSYEDISQPLGPSTQRVDPYVVCTKSGVERSGRRVPLGYDPTAIRSRFGASTRYVLVRPDFIIFSQASTLEQVSNQLNQVMTMLD